MSSCLSQDGASKLGSAFHLTSLFTATAYHADPMADSFLDINHLAGFNKKEKKKEREEEEKEHLAQL